MEFYARFAEQAYEVNRAPIIEDYILSDEDSNTFMAVYKNKNDIIVSFKGTAGVSDILTDLDICFSVGFSSRWKRSHKDFEKLCAKYPNAKFYLASHSLGGAINNLIARDFPVEKVYNYNCGTGLVSWIFQRKACKTINYHILGDIISAGHLTNKVTLHKRKRNVSRHSIEQFTL